MLLPSLFTDYMTTFRSSKKVNLMANDLFKSEGDINYGIERDNYISKIKDSKTKELLERDSKVFYHQALSTPCMQALSYADQSSIFDIAGNDYLDFHGNNVHLLGYGHPRLIAALQKQMNTLPFSPRRFTNETIVQLAEELVKRSDRDMGRVLFSPSGAIAMGMAIKLARKVTGRYKTISLWDSFHGASMDTISIGGEAIFRNDIGPLMPGAHLAPPPDPQGCLWQCGDTCNAHCASYIEYILKKEGDIAAVIAEPMRSVPIIPPAEYWQRIRKACDEHGTLLIFDEIPNGLGRTGSFYTYKQYGIIPDMVVLGKALGGGLIPFAGVLGKSLFNAVLNNTAIGHYTYEKNPLGAAVALELMKILDEENLIALGKEKSKIIEEEVKAWKYTYKIIDSFRASSLLMGIVLDKDHPYWTKLDVAEFLMYECLRNGLNFKVSQGHILTLTPPLTITISEIKRALNILKRAFDALYTRCQR